MILPKLPLVGDTLLGKYRLGAELGRGGMGVVYEAMHLRMAQKVAIKVLLPEIAQRPELTHRFEREARAAARLRGRHTVRVHDVDETPDGLPFLVMEFLEGRSLREELARHRQLPIEDAVRYVREACEGVEEAHRAGIIHRDLKPANLFLSVGGDEHVVKVVDFGIAKTLDAAASDFQTETNTPLGTYRYMSPEQGRSPRSVDARSDIWSLGVVLYQLLTGKTPFSGPGAVGIMFAIATQPPRPLRSLRADVPEALVAIIERALSKEPAGRHASARELSDELAPFGGSPLVGRRLSSLPPNPPARSPERPSRPFYDHERGPAQAVYGPERGPSRPASRPDERLSAEASLAPLPGSQRPLGPEAGFTTLPGSQQALAEAGFTPLPGSGRAPAPSPSPSQARFETEKGREPSPSSSQARFETEKGLAPDRRAHLTPTDHPLHEPTNVSTAIGLAPDQYLPVYARRPPPDRAQTQLAPWSPTPPWPHTLALYEPHSADDTSSEKSHAAQIKSAAPPQGPRSRRSTVALWLVAGASSLALGVSLTAGIVMLQGRSQARPTPATSASAAPLMGTPVPPIEASSEGATPRSPPFVEALRGQTPTLPISAPVSAPSAAPPPAEPVAPDVARTRAESSPSEASTKPLARTPVKATRSRPPALKPSAAPLTASPPSTGAAPIASTSKPPESAERPDVRAFD